MSICFLDIYRFGHCPLLFRLCTSCHSRDSLTVRILAPHTLSCAYLWEGDCFGRGKAQSCQEWLHWQAMSRFHAFNPGQRELTLIQNCMNTHE